MRLRWVQSWLVSFFLATSAHALTRAVMEGIPASNNAILVDTTTPRVTVPSLRVTGLSNTVVAVSSTGVLVSTTVSGSSITPSNVILLQSTLQSGATFFVSSGTVNNLNTGTSITMGGGVPGFNVYALRFTDLGTPIGSVGLSNSSNGFFVSDGNGAQWMSIDAFTNGVGSHYGLARFNYGLATTSATVVDLTASTLVKADANQKLASAASSDVISLFSGCSGVQYLGADGACHPDSGGGGASALGLSSGSATNSVVVSSPTSNIVVDSNTFVATLQGVSTGFLRLNPSSVTLQGNNLSATYLTNSSATATYLQLSSATATYLQQSSAAATYLQQSSATATYLQQSSAVVTYIQVSTTLAVGHGGTNLTSAVDDNVMVGNGATWQSKAVPNCTDSSGNHLNYDITSNAFSCGTSIASGSGLYIQNTSVLQSGATFYVSSGTAVDLNVTNALTLGTGTNSGTWAALQGTGPAISPQSNYSTMWAEFSSGTFVFRDGTGSTATVVGATMTIPAGNLVKMGALGRIVDGGSPSGGTPGGSSGQLQYNNAGSFGGVTNSIVTTSSVTFGTPVRFANSNVTIENTANLTIGQASFTVVGATTSANLVDISTASSGPFMIRISTTGHWINQSVSSPTLSSCGTGPSVNANCSDVACTITPGSAAGGCGITFVKAYSSPPTCVLTEQTMSLVNALSYVVTASSITVTQTGLTSKLDYHCIGKD